MNKEWQRMITLGLLILLIISSLPLCTGISPAPKTEPMIRFSHTIIVNASGSGDYTRIQWAVDNASEGDTIYVDAGMYRENIRIQKTISLVGAGSESTTIDGGDNNIVINLEADHVNISGFNLTNGYAGIYAFYSDYCSIVNNTCMENRYGLYLDSSYYNQISNNTFNYNAKHGITIYNSYSNTIDNNICSMNEYNGIYINWLCDGNNIVRNRCLNNNYGIYLYGAEKNHISNNILNSNNDGLHILSSRSNELIYNTCNNNSRAGIYLSRSSSNNITNNVCKHNYYYGINLIYSQRNVIDCNTVILNAVAGIYLEEFSNDNSIVHNNCLNTNVAIKIDLCWNNTILKNNCSENNEGIKLSDSFENVIRENNCHKNNNGISLTRCSDNNKITANTCEQNGYGIYCREIVKCFISNNNCNDNLNGICCEFAQNCTLSSNTCAGNNQCGISLKSNYNNNVSSNICKTNSFYGINVDTSYYNVIGNNSCQTNNYNGFYIYGSGDNEVRDNYISSNFRQGAYIEKSNNNTFIRNCISNNHLHGILLESGTHNRIYSNDFLSNNGGGIQASGNGKENEWNGCERGNYWTDWKQPDTNADRIVDIPYVIQGTGGGKDMYPLVDPFSTVYPIADAGLDIVIDQHQTVTFNSSRCTHRSAITGYLWSFFYGGIQIRRYGSSPTFIFHDAGIYEVKLSATNTVGALSEDVMNVTVRDITPPAICIRKRITLGSHEKIPVNGSKCTDNVGIVNFTWTYIHEGYFYIHYGMYPSISFRDIGEYSIDLRVVDGEGNWAEETIVVEIIDALPPEAVAGEDRRIRQYERLVLRGSGTSDNVGITNYTWSFTYGGESPCIYQRTFRFTFDVPGYYRITLRVTDLAGNSDTDLVNVTVDDATDPTAYAGEDAAIDVNSMFHFSADGSWDNICIVNWSWVVKCVKSDITLYGEHQNYFFDRSGNYFIYLTVRDAEGNEGTDWMKLEVNDIEAKEDVGYSFAPSLPETEEETGRERGSPYIMAVVLAGMFLAIMIPLIVFKFKRQKGTNHSSMDELERSRSKIEMGNVIVIDSVSRRT